MGNAVDMRRMKVTQKKRARKSKPRNDDREALLFLNWHSPPGSRDYICTVGRWTHPHLNLGEDFSRRVKRKTESSRCARSSRRQSQPGVNALLELSLGPHAHSL